MLALGGQLGSVFLTTVLRWSYEEVDAFYSALFFRAADAPFLIAFQAELRAFEFRLASLLAIMHGVSIATIVMSL